MHNLELIEFNTQHQYMLVQKYRNRHVLSSREINFNIPCFILSLTRLKNREHNTKNVEEISWT